MEIISCKDAKQQGFKRYFTGKPCKHGHVAERAVINGTCVKCSDQYAENRQERIDGKRYFTGKPCKHGHIAERLASNGVCMECARIRASERDIDAQHAAQKRNREKHKIKRSVAFKTWREKNIEHHKELTTQWKIENEEHIRTYHRDRCRTKWQTDINHRLRVTLRGRVSRLLTGGVKRGSMIRDLGCSIDECVAYITKQFTDLMNWDNWGIVWELDHVKPLFQFDLTNREEFLAAAHYTNLQPLSVDDHRRKSAAERSRSSKE